jgi:uncharacterized protein with FMN-binding domain
MEEKNEEKKEVIVEGKSKFPIRYLLHLMPAVIAAFIIIAAIITNPLNLPQLLEIKAQEDTQEETQGKDRGKKSLKETEAPLEVADIAYTDGIYYGSGVGYAGKISVKVVVEDSKISQIELTEVEADDEAFVKKAKGVIEMIIATQMVEVDAVSGATYSSRGILEAVKNALFGEESQSAVEDKGNKTEEPEDVVGIGAPEGGYIDGTYYGEGRGFDGMIKVQVVIQDTQISEIEVVSYEGDGASYMESAKGVIAQVISTQSTSVDAVTGATYSSKGILQAINNALSQAIGDGSSSDGSEEEKPEEENGNKDRTPITPPSVSGKYKDGTYYGEGNGFAGKIKAEVVIAESKISSIELVEVEADNEPYISNAKGVIGMILQMQGTSVDVVTGATYSSNGIIEAVNAALRQALVSADEGETEVPKPEPETEEAKPPVNPVYPSEEYIDGKYEGTGEGFAGEIKVRVTIKKGRLEDIKVISIEADNEPFVTKAKAVIKTILALQRTDIDGITGATYSSEGIIEAVNSALSKAVKPKETDPLETETPETEIPEETETPEIQPSGADEVLRDGSYQIAVECEPDEEEDFMTYLLSLKVVIRDGRIAEITDVAGSGDDYISANTRFINKAVKGIVDTVINNQSIDGIDAVTGATCSSVAIIEAINQAIISAMQK